MVNEKINKELFGINTCVKYMNKTTLTTTTDGQTESTGQPNEEEDDTDQVLSGDVLKEALSRNLLYLVYINMGNEQFNSISLVIFNKWRLNNNKKKLTIKGK